MSSKLKTAIAFAKNIRTTGAITQTSKKTEQEITAQITDATKLVVELGMGHGNITSVILSKLSNNAEVLAFEVNPEFCQVVRDTIPDPRLTVINDSAENLESYLKERKVDVIISSLPLTMFPKQLLETIMNLCVDVLIDKGHYSQILYNKKTKSTFSKYYSSVEINGNLALPPQYVYHCSNPKKGL